MLLQKKKNPLGALAKMMLYFLSGIFIYKNSLLSLYSAPKNFFIISLRARFSLSLSLSPFRYRCAHIFTFLSFFSFLFFYFFFFSLSFFLFSFFSIFSSFLCFFFQNTINKPKLNAKEAESRRFDFYPKVSRRLEFKS